MFMNTTAKVENCRARRHAGGFTLAELLTVVLIISLLMAMLAPTMYSVYFSIRKGLCQSNLHSIVNEANRYAQADSKGRLPTLWSQARPTPASTWGNMKTGNPGCLALLIDAKYAARDLFLCPEARSTRGFTMMAMDANTFTYIVGVSTLSYSYISMVYNSAWKTSTTPLDNVADQMTMEKVPGTLVVIADQNPRCVFGTQTLNAYNTLKDLSGTLLTKELRRNALNHKNKGQNVARWDASVKWITDANNPNTPEDDIYTSARGTGTTDEAQGRRKDMNDAFLIP